MRSSWDAVSNAAQMPKLAVHTYLSLLRASCTVVLMAARWVSVPLLRLYACWVERSTVSIEWIALSYTATSAIIIMVFMGDIGRFELHSCGHFPGLSNGTIMISSSGLRVWPLRTIEVISIRMSGAKLLRR